MISVPDQYSDVEIVAVDTCTSTNYKHRIICIYNPPNSNLDRVNSLCTCLEGVTNVAYLVSILVEFNFPEIDGINMKISTSITANTFLSHIRDFGLKQIVTVPTRGDNLLDINLCNNPMNLLNVSVVEPIAYCNHSTILIKMRGISFCNNNCNIKYNFYNTDFESFLN